MSNVDWIEKQKLCDLMELRELEPFNNLGGGEGILAGLKTSIGIFFF
jgi:hypothetical protein